MAAEAELNVLKKLESNKYCVNCDAYNKFGHGNICEKFKTFVCSNCKSAHQSFSMRVKSVTMSNWTKEEVDALKEENGGGNAVAKRVWLGLWDESKLRKPKEGDHVDVYKRFIDKVYNDRAFYDESAASNPSPSKKSGGSSRNVTAPSSSSSSNAANLLDFSSPTASSSAPTFDAFASPTKSASPANDGWGAFSSAPAPAPVAAASSTGFDDGFGAFMAAPAAPANPMAAFDPFASSSASAAPSSSSSFAAPSQPAFDPFAPSNAARIAPSQSFGFGGAPQAPAPMARPPPANFSAFDALAGPQPGMGMGGMGGMGMGMGMGGGMGGPRPGMMNGNMGMGTGMGMGMGMPQQPAMGMGMGMGMGGGPRPMMGGGNGYMGAPPQNGYGARPGVNSSVGSRDPFAGLGLPGK